MSTQIALYKLDAIRKSLVANRFNKKKADNLKTIGKLVYDAVLAAIPEYIMDMFIKEESDYINYDPKVAALRRYETKYFKVTNYISWWSSDDIIRYVLTQMLNDGINLGNAVNSSIYVDLPSPLPAGDNYISSILMDEVKKKGKLYEAIKEYILRNKEMITLDNKIKCLFSSKRFYTSTLKNEFPEAYEVYVKKFEEGNNSEQESTSEPTTCDSIESIRATLLSNK